MSLINVIKIKIIRNVKNNLLNPSMYLSYLTARPKSAMAHVRFGLTSIFLDFISRWTIAGLPRAPWISRCRCDKPLAADCARFS